MLKRLKIQDLALCELINIELEPGFSALTGESGAGKSVLIDCLALLTGAARPRIRPRHGCKTGFVEGEFTISKTLHPSCFEVLAQSGFIELGEESLTLILARRIDASGRARSYLQGQMVNRQILTSVTEGLIELCSQNESHGLRHTSSQLKALDEFAGLQDMRAHFEADFRKLKALELLFEKLEQGARESASKKDFLEFQLAELNEIPFQDYEESQIKMAELGQELELTRFSSQLQKDLGNSDLLKRLPTAVAQCANLESEQAQALTDQIAIAQDSLFALTRQLEQLAQQKDSTREALALELQSSLHLIEDLARKHRCTATELSLKAVVLKDELDASLLAEENLALAASQLTQERLRIDELASRLHKKRLAAQKDLVVSASREFAGVDLEGARLEVHLSKANLGPSGFTFCEFGFSPDASTPARPIGKVASGGELARILLCLKLATQAQGALLIFDEIDAGAGGNTAEKIGYSLRRAAEHSQLLAVTHWPQVAAVANCHLLVSKEVEGNKHYSQAYSLEPAARQKEVARMLGGNTNSADEHARQLLAQRPNQQLSQKKQTLLIKNERNSSAKSAA